MKLSQHDDITENYEFNYQLSEQRSLQEPYKGDDNCFRRLIELPNDPHKHALASIHDLGCPFYVENQVFQLQMFAPPSMFVSCVNGVLVYEIRLSNHEPSAELLYNIKLLHCMRGAPRLANLIGIIVNTNREYLKSYLTKYSKTRGRIDRIAEDPSISCNRRQKWAEQLVETVADLHSKGFVAGMICAYRMPMIIESSDNEQFFFFQKAIRHGLNSRWLLPSGIPSSLGGFSNHRRTRMPRSDLKNGHIPCGSNALDSSLRSTYVEKFGMHPNRMQTGEFLSK